jgi:hypothetical protein
MNSNVISIAVDFSPAPAGRNVSDGPYPGAKFRDEFLVPALRSHDSITVDLDGTAGMGSSFLEEAFGGLVRLGFTESELRSRLRIRSSRQSYEERIWNYIRQARVAAHN